MKFYYVLQARKREEKDLKTSRQKKNERIKKVTSVPSSNTLSLSSFSLLPTNKVA
jgi:hypothetical protein